MSIATLEKPKNRRRNGAFPFPDPPLLLNGDHLAVPEFERRYGAMPEVKKAELIEGIVVMSPPISNLHAETHGMLGAYLRDRKSTRLNSSHVRISYAVFCLKKK